MRFLFAVFVFSTAVLLWAAYAIARTVRRHGRGKLADAASLSLKSKPADDVQHLPDEH